MVKRKFKGAICRSRGRMLTKMIQTMAQKRSDVYIGNIMNGRPQMPTVEGREEIGNRPPAEGEMCTAVLA